VDSCVRGVGRARRSGSKISIGGLGSLCGCARVPAFRPAIAESGPLRRPGRNGLGGLGHSRLPRPVRQRKGPRHLTGGLASTGPARLDPHDPVAELALHLSVELDLGRVGPAAVAAMPISGCCHGHSLSRRNRRRALTSSGRRDRRRDRALEVYHRPRDPDFHFASVANGGRAFPHAESVARSRAPACVDPRVRRVRWNELSRVPADRSGNRRRRCGRRRRGGRRGSLDAESQPGRSAQGRDRCRVGSRRRELRGLPLGRVLGALPAGATPNNGHRQREETRRDRPFHSRGDDCSRQILSFSVTAR
jgi:hypothetical protein